MEIKIFLPHILFLKDTLPDLRYEILDVYTFLRIPLTLATQQKEALLCNNGIL
jgi:hypothetical protein